MPSNGLTLVEGINEVVETIGEFPMTGSTAPAADGTSVYSRGRSFLERETKRIISEGWPENTELAKKYDLAESTGILSLAAETLPVLRIQGAGPDRHRNLVLRTDSSDPTVLKVWDADQKSFDLRIRDGDTDRSEVYLDVTLELAFPEITPLLQDVILAKAKMLFQRRLQGNPSVDQALQQEFIMANRAAGRNDPHLDQNFNIRDEFQAMRRGGTNDRAGVMNRSGGQQQQQ
tara:strand:- start:6332 stop:7027 length:696 start_codon:yes stop_codon:yes gene_type:complete